MPESVVWLEIETMKTLSGTETSEAQTLARIENGHQGNSDLACEVMTAFTAQSCWEVSCWAIAWIVEQSILIQSATGQSSHSLVVDGTSQCRIPW